MQTQEFEAELKQMTKPKINELEHEQIITKAIINARANSVLSWWWLFIPVYVIAMFCMKSLFVPAATLISEIKNFSHEQRFVAAIFFIITPITFIAVNFISIKRVYFLSGNPKSISFLKFLWMNVVSIIASIIILIIYLL